MVFLGARLARQQSRSGGISGPDHGLSSIVHGAGGQDESSNRRVRQVDLAQPRAHVALRVRRQQTADEHASRPRAPSLPCLRSPTCRQGERFQSKRPAGLTTVHTSRPRHILTFTYTVRSPGMCGTQSQNHTPLIVPVHYGSFLELSIHTDDARVV